MKLRFDIAIALLLMLLWVNGNAQMSEYNHPELKWMTIEAEHNVVHYHQGTEATAREVLGIAEQVYQPITDLYDYYPKGKIHWIIRDHDDYSNGASYYYDQKIEIWATPLDFELRGQHHWLYDVVSHEFTHMIQLGASRKGPRWMPQIYFQGFGYEEEKRPDVLYGYPNRIASWPIVGTTIPMWFAEGTAQYQVHGLGHDYWDSHRDMMLRTWTLDDTLLSYSQMGVFGKNSLGSESVYNHGYGLVLYITDRWGEDNLRKLSDDMRNGFNWTFDRACRQTLGLSEKELVHQWQDHLKTSYLENTEIIRNNIHSGRIICDEGFGNLYPAISPDGRQLAFISNKGQDYMSLGKLYIYNLEKDTLSDTKCNANGPVQWSPDGKYLTYGARREPDRHGSHYYDVFLWDVKSEREIRLTNNARLNFPSFSPDGNRIVAVYNAGGTQNLALVSLPEEIKGKDISEGVEWHLLTDLEQGTQVFRPRFSPDGSWIVCTTANLGLRDIYRFDLDSQRWAPLIATEHDERDLVFSNDGNTIYWADDRTGIFNIYSRKFDSPDESPITNVTGGAFMPCLGPDGEVAYAEYTSKGYGIRLMQHPEPVAKEFLEYRKFIQSEHHQLQTPPTISGESRPYDTPFGTLFFMPRLFWDRGKLKPGFYAMTNDVLEKLLLFGGVSVGFDGERDLYMDIEYQVLYPTLYLEAFNMTRNQREEFDDTFVIIGEDTTGGTAKPIYDKYAIDYEFNLTEFDLGARIPLKKGYGLNGITRVSEYKAVMNFDDGGSFDYTYHRGKAYILHLTGSQIAMTAQDDIHPTGGWQGWFEYARENNKFIDGFKVDAERGTIGEVFTNYNFHRLETEIDYYHKLYKGLVINPRIMGGFISDNVDPFYNLYAGGLPGLRGYSFYSMGGTRKAVTRLYLRFPILTGIDRRWGPFYLDRIHGALFAEAGDAWTGDFDLDNLKKDVGAELRFKLFSWYGFPTAVQLSGAYGMDNFTVSDDSGNHTYGDEFRWYLTVLFNFL